MSMNMIELKRRKLITGALSFLVYANCNKAIAKMAGSAPGIQYADVNALRNSQQINVGDVIVLNEYTQGSGKGGGSFKVDPSDTTTPDDGGYCFVNQSQQRLKRICANNTIAASSFGITGQPGDNTGAFKNFMRVNLDKVIDVNIYTGGVAQVANNTRVVGGNNTTIFATADIYHDPGRTKNNQGQTLEVGDNCHLENVKINGMGYKNNGFLVDSRKNVVIKNCQVKNGKGQALLDIMGQDCTYDGNTLSTSQHGIQLWLSKGTVVSNNTIFQVTGGIWTACATNVSVTKNYIHDCADVGIDWEGGNNCTSDSNRVEHCANGELAVFASGRQLLKYNVPMGNLYHKNNTVVRGGQYLSRDGTTKTNSLGDAGACMIYGNLDEHLIGPIVFEGNIIKIEDSNEKSVRCFSSRGSSGSDANIIFKNNKFTSYSSDMGQLRNLNNVQFTGNEFSYAGNGYKPTATAFQNINHLSVVSNTVTVNNNQHDTPPWMLYHWAEGNNKVEITNNTFTGFKSYAFVINNQNEASPAVIKNNNFKQKDNSTVSGKGYLIRGMDN